MVQRQHGVITRAQLLEAGLDGQVIKRRIAAGRLHPVWSGVYAVGRPELGRRGVWMAAVLSCGPTAALSHHSAAALWGIRRERPGAIHLSVPRSVLRKRPGIVVHRRAVLETTTREGIPVTTIVSTLVDLARCLKRSQLEAAVNDADKLGLIDPEALRAAAEGPGAAALRRTLDRHTVALTDSELERRFLRLVHKAGLPKPETQAYVNGFRVDFHWPDARLVVETDGLRYHRTPAQQARDRLRDQAHTAAGLTPLRFTHAQVVYEPDQVARTLAACMTR